MLPAPTSGITPPPSHWRRVAATVALLAVGLSILLTAFALPSLHLSPHQVPIAVAGPSPATAELSADLARKQPDAFSVTEVASADQARTLILDREVYGAVVVDPDGRRCWWRARRARWWPGC